MNKFKALLLICSVICMASCNSHKKEKDNEAPQPGKYVFEDDNMIYHLDNLCFKLRNGKDEHGHDIYAMNPIDTDAFYIHDDGRFCSRCVSITDFEKLKEKSKINIKKKELYDAFILADYDMGSYMDFVNDLSDPSKRRKAYDACQTEGWSVGTFEEFSKFIGY